MSNDVYLAKISKIRKNFNYCSEAVGIGHTRNEEAGSEIIIYRRGVNSNIKAVSEMQMTEKLNNISSTVNHQSIELSSALNNFNRTERDNGENKDVFRNFSEHDYIFGSTSPRGMSTSDYLGSGHTNNVAAQTLQGIPSSGSLQKDNNESDNNISSCSTLDIVNKVDNVSLNALEKQIKELSQRLQTSETSRNDFKRKLEEAAEEKEQCYRRLEVISAAHESRITEMHCVIAELSKKLRTKQENTIMEENEPEGSEISYQEGSIYNSELNFTNPDAECQTDPLDGEFSAGVSGKEEMDTMHLEVDDDQKLLNETVKKTQVEALQEEVLHLRAQIALLQSEIANPFQNENDNNDVLEENEAIEIYDNDAETDAINDDTIFCRPTKNCYEKGKKLRKTEISLKQKEVKGQNLCNRKNQQSVFVANNPEICMIMNNSAISNDCNKKYLISSNNMMMMMTSGDNYSTGNNGNSKTSPQDAQIVLKMAEKVKLRRTTDSSENVTTTDVINTAIQNMDIMEHSDTTSNNMIESFMEASKIDSEFQRLQRRIEHLKMRNTVLSLTLQECKEHCEHLYLLCGKYESNAIALQSAVNCSDRAIEAYDVMLALLESKLAILKENSEAAEDSRKAVESVAKHLLDRLESEKDMSENSLGPWQNTFCISDKPFEPWTHDDDNRLRNHVSKLKGRRSNVQNTIVNLESPFSSFYEKSRMALESNKELKQEKHIQIDMETAVLMQELLNLREENIQLKKKREEAERDRQFAMDKICILQDALQQLQTQLSADSDALFHITTEDRSSFSEADHAALTERQLVEALTRESELKSRIQSLIGSVSASRKTSDEKYEEVQNNIKELQKSNINLSQSLEQTKRKYQSKIRKLEQKILEMSIETGNHNQSQHQHRSSMLSQENVPETTL